MVLDPNWGTNLFRTYLDARRSRQQEGEAVDERSLRGLQRQQIETGMRRQQEQDVADDQAAEWEASQAAPVAPIAPPRPTKTPPDVFRGGTPPGLKIAPSIVSRGEAGRKAAVDGIQNAAVQEASKDPDFLAMMVGQQAPVPPKAVFKSRSGDFYRRQMAEDRERRMKAPLEAEKLGYERKKDERDFGLRDRAQKSAEGQRSDTRNYQNKTLEETIRQNKLEDASRALRDEETAYGPSPLKMAKQGIAALGGKVLDVAGNIGTSIFAKAPIEAAKSASREKIATAKLEQAKEALKQKETLFNRNIQAMQAENDAKRRQEIGRDVYRLQGEIARDRSRLNAMREREMYETGGADPAAALGQEGGAPVTIDGWFGDTTQSTVPVVQPPVAPQPVSVLQDQARAAVASMTPQQKAEAKARLRAMKGQ